MTDGDFIVTVSKQLPGDCTAALDLARKTSLRAVHTSGNCKQKKHTEGENSK